MSSLLQWRSACTSRAVVKCPMDIEVTVDAEWQLTFWAYVHLQEKKENYYYFKVVYMTAYSICRAWSTKYGSTF